MRGITGLVVSAGFLLPGVTQAQTASDNDVLLEACNALPQKAKRLECLKALFAKTSAVPTVEKSPAKEDPQVAARAAALEALRGKFLDFDAAVSTGVSLRDFQAQTVTLAQAVARFKAGVPVTSEVDAKLDSAITAFKDAAQFWDASITFYARSDNRIAYGGGLPIDSVGMRRIANTYSLPLRRADIFGLHAGVNPDEGRSLIIGAGRASFKSALDILSDPTSPPVSAAPTPAVLRQADANRPAMPTKACPQDVIDRMRADGQADAAINLSCGG